MSFDDLFAASDAAAFHPTHLPVPRKLNRMSSLPVVQYCPAAARLGAQYGAGRAAAMSSYFHARCAGVPCAIAVSPEELEEINTWHTPTDVTLWDGEVLRYEDAEKEVHVGLGWGGEWVDPNAHDADTRLACEGHLDFAWMHTVGKNESCPREHIVVYVADIKKTRWTTLDGPESLQLMAYGVAFALKWQAAFMCTGIFVAEDGEWQWLNRLIAVDSDEFRAIQARVMAAAQNTEGQASTGSHCHGCYARLHCPDHMLAATAAIGWLSPIAEGHREATPEEYTRMLLAAQHLKEIAEKAIKLVHVVVDRGHVLKDAESGKVFKPIACKGKESVTVKSLREQMGEEANKYISRGKSFFQHRWVNP